MTIEMKACTLNNIAVCHRSSILWVFSWKFKRLRA